MRQTRVRTLVVSAAAILMIALVGCTSPLASSGGDSEFEIGESVAAKWTDGNLWLAEVRAIGNSEVTVEYADDKSTKTVRTSEVRPIPTRKWAVGDKVLAVWTTGRFYEGVISQAGEHSCEVKWDDGSPPSDVPVDRIIAR